MIFLGRNGLIVRGWRYYRRHGWERSMNMLRSKFAAHKDVGTTQYVEGFNGVANGGAGVYSKKATDAAHDWNPFSRSVTIIGDTNLPQCKKYRILQKLEALEGLGVKADYSFWGDVPRSLNQLQTASCAIFYRMQENSEFEAYFAEARRLGIPIGYDIDDPIFDQKVYGENVNLKFLKEQEAQSLVAAADSYRRAMARCDFVVVSTPGMKELAAKSSRNVFIWRNSVDAEARHWSDLALRESPQRPPGQVVIGYSSGSRAHEADFRVIEESLLAILRQHPQSRLRVIGHLEPPESFKEFEDRIETLPLTSYGDYLRSLAGVDINLVPLVADGFNHCKSAIRYLDAATVGVPTVASRTGDFVNVVEDGKTGFLAGTAEEWQERIGRLVKDTKLRRAMGKRAREAAMARSAVATEAGNLDPKLARILLEGAL